MLNFDGKGGEYLIYSGVRSIESKKYSGCGIRFADLITVCDILASHCSYIFDDKIRSDVYMYHKPRFEKVASPLSLPFI